VGDDVFLVLLENVHERSDAIAVSERIRTALLEATTFIGDPVFIGAHYGIAFGTATLTDPGALVAEARARMADVGPRAPAP